MSNLVGFNLSAKRFPTRSLVLKGIPYVPHYRNESVYVGPGYGKHNFDRYSEQQLLLKGAQYQSEVLWQRGVDGVVNEKNP